MSRSRAVDSYGLCAIVISGVVGLTGCGGDSQTPDATFDDAQTIVDYTDKVIIPTYSLLKQRCERLEDTIVALQAAVTTETLAEAQKAWIDARQPWEQNEAYLFGPVVTGYDNALDNWPLNQATVDAIVGGDDPITPALIAGQDSNAKGFHAVEYLLFGTNKSKTAADFTNPRELDYINGVVAEMVDLATTLESDWTVSYNGGEAYGEVLRTAGQGSTAYPSLGAAAQEMIQGMIGICDEVANGKIATPYEEQRPDLVESHFAYNSIVDFQNNIRSVQNAYLGSNPAAGESGICGEGGCVGKGLSEFVASIDPALDTRVQTEIDAAIAAIGAIPAPFEESLKDPDQAATIEGAQEAVLQLENTLHSEILPLVSN